MRRVGFLAIPLVGLGLIGLAVAKEGWNSDGKVSLVASERTENSASAYSMRVLNQSDNMNCSIQSSGDSAVLRIVPPNDVNQILVIHVVKTNAYLDANDSYEPEAGSGKRDALLFDPRDAEAFEFNNRNMTSRKVRMFSGDGEYHFLMSERFDEPWEYEAPEAWCKVEVRRRYVLVSQRRPTK